MTKAPDIPATTKLHLDGDALVANWRYLDELSGAASAGAAVKADAYGLGVAEVVKRLSDAGCQDFFVANWSEAREIESFLPKDIDISVLNGVRQEDMPFAAISRAKPVLNSMEQVQRWASTGRPCDLMIETGMNRLGVDALELNDVSFDSLSIDLAMSHLASADEDVSQNREQLEQYCAALKNVSAKRASLANSAGIALGPDFHFDCTRPGLSLYGGKPRQELSEAIKQVVFPQAQILQIRKLKTGDKLGYNAKYIAKSDMNIAILAMGYADGYLRGFSNSGTFISDGIPLAVLGRVSMDLIAIDISSSTHLSEGDWVECEYDLPKAAEQSGLSQYELLTGLGIRLERVWQ